MTALFAGLTTLDVLHRLDHVPDVGVKVTSTGFTMAAGGPATNAAVTYAALSAAARSLSIDEAVAPSSGPASCGDGPVLLTALGSGPVSAFLAADLAAAGVTVLDATTPLSADAASPGDHATASPASHLPEPGERGAAQASSPTSREPAISSIIEHPAGRMVASTNARLEADPARVAAELPRRVGVVLIDGHNPVLAAVGLDLAARVGALSVMDAGSWKDDAANLPGCCDVVAASARFYPPGPSGLMAAPEDVAHWLLDAGAHGAVITRGADPALWWCAGARGAVAPPRVEAVDTLGAGDIFHGALAHGLVGARRGDIAGPVLGAAVERACAVAAASTEVFGTRAWRQRVRG